MKLWWGNLKLAIGVTLIGLVVVALIGLASTGSVFYKGAEAKLTNRAREARIVFDPNRTLATYEGFYDQCRAVVALNGKIAAAQASLKERTTAYNKDTDPFGNEAKGINGLRESVRALTNQRIETAQQYNADASKNTRAPFRATDLPYTIDAPYGDVECGQPKEAQR